MARVPARSPRPLVALVAVLIVLLAAATLVSRLGHRNSGAPSGGTGLATVHAGDLPPQARATLALIVSGGPFPFEQDGVVFTNREGLLPGAPSGYYREYTVLTPGSPDRGARRIITGGRGERYYTADHYSSFREVLP